MSYQKFLFNNTIFRKLHYFKIGKSPHLIGHHTCQCNLIKTRANKIYLGSNTIKNSTKNKVYNQQINTQLKNFFKNYKYEKLVNNYKEFNKQITTKSFFSPTILDSTLKVNKQNIHGISSEDYRFNYGSPLKSASLSNISITYNKLKQQVKNSTKKDLSKTSDDMSQNMTDVRLSLLGPWQSILRSNKMLHSPLFLSKNTFLNRQHSSKFVRSLSNSKSTYCFLQTLLVKYLDIRQGCVTGPQSSTVWRSQLAESALPINNSVRHNLPWHPMAKYVFGKKAVFANESKNQYFLFNKIKNKSYLGYWLLPVAGFAFITPHFLEPEKPWAWQRELSVFTKLLTQNETITEPLCCPSLLGIRKNSFLLQQNESTEWRHYPRSYQMLLKFKADKVSLQKNIKVEIENLNQQDNKYLANLEPNLSFQKNQSLIIKKTFNNLYNFIKAKRNLNKTNNKVGVSPLNVQIKHKFSKFKVIQKIPYIFNNNKLPFRLNDYYSNFQTINPLHSIHLLNNNLNFLQSKNTLKLLKMKFLKLPISSCFFVESKADKNILTINQKYTQPFDSYKEGLSLINTMPQKMINCGLCDGYYLILDKANALRGVETSLVNSNLDLNKLPVLKYLSGRCKEPSLTLSVSTSQLKTKHQVLILNNLENKNILLSTYFDSLIENSTLGNKDFGFRKKKGLPYISNLLLPTFSTFHETFSGDSLAKVQFKKALLIKDINYNQKDFVSIKKNLKVFSTFNDFADTTPASNTFFDTTIIQSKHFLNSLSVLFKHQKMFNSKTEAVKIRLHFQKKRKAKKQRLETRRQKKRTRFFPRPIWLRYRMFLNFINQRCTLSNKMGQKSFKLNTGKAKQFFWKNTTKQNFWFYNISKIKQLKIIANTRSKSTLPLKGSFFLQSMLSQPLTKQHVPLELTNIAKIPLNWNYQFVYNTLQSKQQKSKINAMLQTLRYYNFRNHNSNNPQFIFSKIRYFIKSYFDFGKSYKLLYLQNYFNKTSKLKKKQVILRDIKIKANYNNFKNQKSNSQPPTKSLKDNDKDTMFRDFWIWAYNNTFNYIPVKSILPENKNNKYRLIFPKSEYNLLRINWALNKTSNNSFLNSNKRYNLWGTQKLRNQSKNNKTKYLEKQFITNWDLRFSHRFYGTIENLEKNLKFFYKKIKTKLKQKTQKLNYLTTYTNIYNNPLSNNVNFLNKSFLADSVFCKTKHIKIFNTSWWSNLNVNTFLTNKSVGNTHQDIREERMVRHNTYTLLLTSCILLHFCALISLVSISQVRCFIKFHLILLYKLSNVYNSLLHKISNYVQSYKQQNYITKSNQLNAIKMNLLELKQNQNQVFTYFSFYLLKKEFNTLFREEIQYNNLNSMKLKQYNTFDKFLHPYINKTNLQIKKFWIRQENFRLNAKGYEANIALNSLLSQYKKNFEIYSKFNIISFKSIFLKRMFSLTYFTPINKYKIHQMQFFLKKKFNILFSFVKNTMLTALFNLINLFQNSARTISNFFEKPAEFTTTWIAYGFLVEWSSDFITIIPENVDIYIWNVFSKISRIIPTRIILNFNYGTFINLISFNNKTNINTLVSFNKTSIAVGNALLLTISHILHRRILYLFDLLMETISQPDSDLIARQEKGSLFWDIWADFLVTAADYYNVNVAALSTIKAEQNTLIENISNDFGYNFYLKKNYNSEHEKLLAKQNHSVVFRVNSEYKESEFTRNHNKTATALGILYYHKNESELARNTNQTKKNSKSKINNLVWPQAYQYSNLTQKINAMQRSKKGKKKSHDTRLHTVLAFFHDRWAVNQYVTYQSWHSHNGSNNSTGDLFIDYHPPKSFSHIPTIKYNSILQQPLGTLVCQIYSGIFNKQISKNVLLVNTKTTTNYPINTDSNVLLIKALAGETELKIITDNAQRYALINRGFAIGIKQLRDVFFAIALNTPCIFLLEDIHAIGERRPMLISDYGGALSDDNGAFKEDFFGSQRDEVHEKNQVVYQLTRHSLTHYKKPFKGDYSLAIPTNLYSLDLFLKQPTPSTSNLSLISHQNITIKNKIKNPKILGSRERTDLSEASISSQRKIAKRKKKFAPPSTSPFSVLLLKEEKKLKPNKIVEELPWTGLPGRLEETKPRTSYSVRAKVAVLAELSLSNLSAKLDMITDLLVIIDSVRSNKGFVVFATTDVPHVLDPALRRPGRLDETICLPTPDSTQLNFNTNYEIIKAVKPRTNFVQNNILNTMLVASSNVGCHEVFSTSDYNSFAKKTIAKQSAALALYSPVMLKHVLSEFTGIPNLFVCSLPLTNNPIQSFGTTVNLKDYIKQLSMGLPIAKHSDNLNLNYAFISHAAKKTHALKPDSWLIPNAIHQHKKTTVILRQITNKTKAIAYYEVGKVLLNYFLNNNKNTYKSIEKIIWEQQVYKDNCDFANDFEGKQTYFSLGTNLNLKSINYLSLYGLKNKIIIQLMLLFGGKMSQLLGQKNLLTKKAFKKDIHRLQKLSKGTNYKEQSHMTRASHKASQVNPNNPTVFLQKNFLGNNSISQDYQNSFPVGDDANISQMFASDDNLRIATSIMLSLIHKRYLYLKNLIVPKLLSFTDGNVFEEPPCPPFSNLLIPAKRFENYKRVFHDSFVGDQMGQRKAQISFTEKQHYHMELQKIKHLKNTKNYMTSVVQNLGLYDSKSNSSPNKLLGGIKEAILSNNTNGDITGNTSTTTNINWYYQTLLLKRHGQYLTNQWWNGQLSEHNAETVFLSDIDWRSSFIKQKHINKIKSKNIFLLSQHKKRYDNLDILLDFPDTDQYYNPRRRRWLLNKGYWSFWFNFDKLYSEEIISSWILESIIQTYTYLHNNTELLDFVTSKFIAFGYPQTNKLNNSNKTISIDYSKTELSSIKEIFLTTSFKRF
uniref:Cell division protein n=1 Tax=Colemanosphaera angeleri TaxID=1454018 RepID=A0A6C0RXQ2_9CHLO|nr:cell division protein [Colemanosphaera angeleri]QIA47169.1 cell division protein [Colemanosphaera angeleri]